MRIKSVEYSRLASILIVGVSVLLFAIVAFTSSLQKSPTYDEPIHLFAGYSYLRWRDFTVNPEHPPLAKVLAALPLLALDVKVNPPTLEQEKLVLQSQDGGWILANRMAFTDNDAATLFFYARLPMIGIAVILGIFIFLWTKEMFGVKAAIAALLIYCVDPNFFAHAPLVHTDVPFTTFVFVGTYFFWRALNRLTWVNLLFTSLFFALSAITKFSFVVVLPIWILLGLVKIFSSAPQYSTITEPSAISSRGGKTGLLLVILGSALIAAYLSIWATYGVFSSVSRELVYLHFPMTRVIPNQAFLRTAISFANDYLLAPEAWLYGVFHVLKSMKRTTYLLGEISNDGFWLYFPLAFAVKTPVPTLLLLLAAFATWIFRRRVREDEIFLLIPVVAYFFLAIWSRMNLGLRHLLPIYPFLFVLVGGIAVELWTENKRLRRGALVLLALWYIWSSLSVYPHYLAYFNEFAGGPKSGHKILVDSNLDWGQDLKGLKQWMVENGVKTIYLAYFGTADPAYYDINAVYLHGSSVFSKGSGKSDSGVPKYVAVSATHLSGVYLQNREFYKPLGLKEPVAVIGHSIFVYKAED